jgi:DNA-binding response OmpR family regulator
MQCREMSKFFSRFALRSPCALSRRAALWQLAETMDALTSKVLVVDDDERLSSMLVEYLAPDGMSVTTAANGVQGLRQIEKESYDLVILDIMLPGLSGLEVLKRLRQSGNRTPVLMLTAKGDDVDRIKGLELGADDYLPKPFNPRELLARAKAILRRTAETENEDAELAVGPLRLHLRRREAWIEDTALKLTNAEFQILAALMRIPGDVVSRESLTAMALGRQLLPDDRSLDTHISNLRKKLASFPSGQALIRSIRGSGYVLIPAS